MTRRAVEIEGFLAQNGWSKAHPVPLAADLSPRRYARLENSDGCRAILMDADDDQRTPQFIALAGVLRDCSISAPEIFASDAPRGFVLMEDFGDRNFGRMIDNGTEAAPLYRRAVDVLVQLHKSFDKSMTRDIDLPVFNAALFTEQFGFFLEFYIPMIQKREASPEERDSFRDAWQKVLQPFDTAPQTLMLRDFMPDNLMDMPERDGLAATGILDFQDGGYGPAAYDVASLCENIRRDGGGAMLDEIAAVYHAKVQPKISADDFRSQCRIFAAVRHMRVLGIVTRWTARTGREGKLPWLPRIEKHLTVLLKDAALQPVREWVEQYTPLH